MNWKKLDEIYEVSEYGDVRSRDRVIQRRGRKHSIKGQTLTHNICRNGYHRVGLNKDSKRKYKAVHRLVARLFVNNPDNKPEVNHIDGDKSNNHYTNLEWVTRSENMKHGYEMGLITHLSDNSKAQRKGVIKTDNSGNKTFYPSLAEASRKDSISISYLSQIINGDRPQKDDCAWAFAVPVQETKQ